MTLVGVPGSFAARRRETMIEMAIGQIFLRAFILCGLIYAFARHEGDYNFQKVAMLVGLIVVVEVMLQMTIGEKVGEWVAIPLMVIVVWLLMKICWLSLKKALVITAAFGLCNLGLNLIHLAIFGGELQKDPVQEELDNRYAQALEIVDDLVGEEGGAGTGMPVEAGSEAEAMPPPARQPAPAATEANTNVIMRRVVSMRYSDEGGYAGWYVTNLVAVPINWEMARSKIKVTARMKKNNKAAVMVNNQVLVVGGTMSVEHDGLMYRWKLAGFTQDRADWEPVAVTDSYRGGY
jgi:hypothetical protein